MNLIEIINELAKFSSPNYVSYPGTTEIDISELEQKLHHKLPNDFKRFLLISNGANINCEEIYGIKNGIPSEDLYDNYIFETINAGNPMPEYMIPIYPDGFGNHNSLDLKTLSEDGETCNVIFWQHDRFYKESDQPDIDAKSFTEFLEKLLKELTEQYNYDGSEK